jgi:hypothetical protein
MDHSESGQGIRGIIIKSQTGKLRTRLPGVEDSRSHETVEPV